MTTHENTRNRKRNYTKLLSHLVVLLFVLFGVFGLIKIVFDASPIAIGEYLVAQVGSGIGITVSVPPNPFNTLAQQLKEKEDKLVVKEKELQQKEEIFQEQSSREQNSQNKNIIIYLIIGGGILLLLIVLNFYLDYRRKSNDTRKYTN